MLPIAIDATRVRILLAGAGMAAARRLARLDDAGAERVGVFCPTPEAVLVEMAGARLIRRLPSPSDIAAAQLVFVAGLPQPTAEQIASIARSAGVLVNVEDDVGHCDFHSAAVVRRGDLTVAVSTDGRSPGMAAALRRLLERRLGPEWGMRLDDIAALRRAWRKAGADHAAIGRWTEAWAQRQGWFAEASQDGSAPIL
jgi:precorrin-2 dehydrogenase/sirohydrochlorin ferrochelatase